MFDSEEALKTRLVETEQLLELRTRQLADCTRAMLWASNRMKSFFLDDWPDIAVEIRNVADYLSNVRANAPLKKPGAL
jgi:hypothetical protein